MASGNRLPERLIASGRLVRQADCYLLKEDTMFRTPSAAALVLTGVHINGRIEWSDADGTTLKAYQIRWAEGPLA